MANDSTHAGQVASEQDTTPINDGYFADAQGEDAFFGPEQLAQAQKVVPMPPDQNVVRVQVNPGEILELSAPFDPGVTMLGREADGNLAIRVGDVTVILVGFVEANAAAPVVVETSDGRPIDIATLLASTDPAIDIQTAAGPGDTGQGGQGADNTGALLTQLQGGNGLGGLNAVGTQDQTQLSYGLIDNAIRLDREDALLSTTLGPGPFRPGMGEAFLHDPIITFQQFQGHLTFAEFMGGFEDSSSVHHDGFDNHWADNDGTFSEPGDITDLTGHATLSFATPGGDFQVDLTTTELVSQHLTSNGVELNYVVADDGATIFAFRGDGKVGDGALIFVVHLNDQHAASADVVYFLVNRLDHATPDDPNDSVRDLLSIGVGFEVTSQVSESPEQPTGEVKIAEGTVTIGFEDDVPVAHEVNYTSYYGNDDAAPEVGKESENQYGHESFDSTKDGKAHIDEDWLKAGNKDHDNNPSSSNSDPAHGDEVGRAIAKGNLNIDFGADGPAGADGNDCTFTLGSDFTLVLKVDTSVEAGFVNADGHVLDSKGNVLMSNGHELKILSDYVDSHGIEHLVVGYDLEEKPESDSGTSTSDLLFSEGASGCEVRVFELTLDVNPDDVSGNGMHFQDFKFELYQGLDQDPDAPTVESNTDLQFKVIGHDDDGDAVHTAINIQVNDDAPTINYISGEGIDTNLSCKALLAAIGDLLGGDIPVDQYGLISSHDKGYVDEDFVVNLPSFATVGNGDQDNTVPGSSSDNTNGDDVGLNLVVGKVDFGADGPSSTVTAQLEVLTQYAVYVDKGGHTYTSGDPDQPLVVLFSNENFLVVGTAPKDGDASPEAAAAVSGGDGLPEIDGNVIFVVAMDNDPSHTLTYGGFVFYLNGPIDHSGQNEQSLIVQVGITAEDADGDSIDAINIQVNDDKPEVCITYCNEDPGSIATLGASTHHDTDFGRIDEDWLKDAPALSNGGFEDPSVSTTFIPLPGGSDQLNGWAIGGAGVDHIGNYWQASEGDQSLDMSNLDAGSISRELTGLMVGREYTVYFDMAGNPDGGPNFVQLKVSAAGEVQGYSFNTAGHSKAAMGWEQHSFTFVADSTTETLTFTSLTNTPYGPALDNVRIVSSADGNQDLDANGNSNANQFGDDYGSSHLAGQINMKYGADGPGSSKLGLDVYETAGGATPDFVNGGGNPTPTSGGHTLVVFQSDPTHLQVGYILEAPVGIAAGEVEVDPSRVIVFDLTLNSAGHFDYEQYKPLDHPDAGTEDNLQLAFDAGSITDGDGDTAAAVIKIQVNDDQPEVGASYQSYASEPADYSNPIYTTNFALIDEDWVRDGQGNQIGNKDEDNASGNEDPNSGDTKGTVVADGRLTVAYGGDGVGTTAPFAFTAKEGDVVQVKDDNGNTIVLKTDTGNTVFAHLLADGGSGSTRLEGFSNPDNSNTFVEGTSTKVFSVSLYPNGGQFQFALLQPVLHSISGKEDNLLLSIGVSAGTDGDGDRAVGTINIQINDDAPHAVNDSQDFLEPDPETGDVHGNVLANDKKGADVYVAFVSNINGPNNQPDGVEIDNGAGQTLAGMNGYLTIYSNGDYHYTPNMGGDLPGPGDDVFTYTLKDADGDTSTATLTFNYTGEGAVSERVAFAPAGPTHEPAPHYDHEVMVSGLLGLNGIVSSKDTSTYHFDDPAGGHVISGGAGNDYITVTGSAASVLLSGNGGDDIIHAGNGGAVLKGGAGDDTLFGGANADSFYGDAGHDAMSGGDGNDTFHADTDDLDGTNTLDGIHAIDGGDGIDTADLSGLKTFDSSQALRLENVEHLAFDGKAAGGGGTSIALSYDAAYGVTQVGGLHALSITGDKADSLQLQASGGHIWQEIGNSHVYEAGVGAAKVTVTVDHDIAVQLS